MFIRLMGEFRERAPLSGVNEARLGPLPSRPCQKICWFDGTDRHAVPIG